MTMSIGTGRLRQASPAVEANPGSTGRAGPPAVVFDRIVKSYDHEPVLDGISFTVAPGTTTVVMGPSGVGKTTLLRILLGLTEPDAGDASIGGRSVPGASDAALKGLLSDVGALLGGGTVHDGSLFASLTARENVRFPLEVRGHDRATVAERAQRRMVEFDLIDVADLLPAEVSGGTRRRIALAKALVEDPGLLVLDDPGTAMDVVNREQIIESIRRARAATGATVVLACHDIDMARALGDDLVVLQGGRVAAAGPCAELLDGVHDADDYRERFADAADPSGAITVEAPAGLPEPRRARVAFLAGLFVLALLYVVLGGGLVFATLILLK